VCVAVYFLYLTSLKLELNNAFGKSSFSIAILFNGIA